MDKGVIMTTEQTAVRTTFFSIASNFALAIIKGAAGVLGNSHALIADAIESTADIFSSFLVYIGLRYSTKPADDNHPYGHGRAEPLITFIVVGFLIIAATLIVYKSIQNIRSPHELPKAWTLFVLGAIILWKEISYRFVIAKSKITDSSSLKADAWHHRTDAITSITAFIGISIALLFGEGYESADDWAALLAAGIILYNSYLIFRPALGEIMDEQVYDELVQKIRKIAPEVDGVLATEKCYVRKSGLKYYIDLHVTVKATLTVKKGHEIAHQVKDVLTEKLPQLGNVLIHIEPDDLG